jgi:hypothetical protein
MNLPDALGQAPTSREELNPLSICSLLCGEQGTRVGRAGRTPKLDGFWVHRMLQAGPPKSHREKTSTTWNSHSFSASAVGETCS